MLSHRVRFDDGPDDRAVELRLEGRHVLCFECRWHAQQWVPEAKPFARALWDFDAHAIRVSERAMPQALVDAANRAFGPLMREEERPRQSSLFPNACCVCGADRNTYPETAIRDGYGNICETHGKQWVTPDAPVEWPCHVCERLVCRRCTLTRPTSSHPAGLPEYYFHTYCSEACRRAAPTGFDRDDDLMTGS